MMRQQTNVKVRVPRRGDDAAFESLIGHIYEAGAEPDAWVAVLERFRDAFRGTGSVLASHDFASGRGRIHDAVGCAPEYVRSYAERYAARDVWIKRERALRTPGAVWTGRQIVSDRELVESEFYAGWVRPQGWFHTIRAVVDRQGDEVWYLAVAAPRSARPYGAGDLALLRRLAPHVQRALRLQRAASELRLGNAAAMEALDRLPVGVALVGEAGTVLAMNAAAKEIVARRDGLRLDANRLEAGRNGDNAALRALIADAAAHHGADEWADGAIALSRPSGGRPLSVLVLPVSASASASVPGAERPAAVVFVGDPERPIEADAGRLCRFHGLTRSEARLAAHVAAGRTLDEAATEMGISRETARTHLKHIFAKTGTQRQAELVGLVLGGLAPMRSGRALASIPQLGEDKTAIARYDPRTT